MQHNIQEHLVEKIPNVKSSEMHNDETLANLTECAKKIPFWQKMMSYISPVKVECTSSSINPKLDLLLSQGRYQLCTPNAVYSYGDLYDNFTRAFDAIELDLLDIKNVLVLGFGLGSVPIILEKRFEKIYDYTAIEIDGKIIDLAKKYVLPDITSPIKIICNDALTYVQESIDKFDLIIVDVFVDNQVPTCFEEKSFLQNIQGLLVKDGLLMYNRLTNSKKELSDSKTFFEQKFKSIFHEATYLDVEGNWMLLNKSDILRN